MGTSCLTIIASNDCARIIISLVDFVFISSVKIVPGRILIFNIYVQGKSNNYEILDRILGSTNAIEQNQIEMEQIPSLTE